MLVQTIFLSSTLAYADETLVNNTGSDANGGFIATQIENESTDEEDINTESPDNNTNVESVNAKTISPLNALMIVSMLVPTATKPRLARPSSLNSFRNSSIIFGFRL